MEARGRSLVQYIPGNHKPAVLDRGKDYNGYVSGLGLALATHHPGLGTVSLRA